MDGMSNVVHNIRIDYGSLDSYLAASMGLEGSLNYILRKEAERRFGSVENFLTKIGLGKIIEQVKKQLGIDNEDNKKSEELVK